MFESTANLKALSWYFKVLIGILSALVVGFLIQFRFDQALSAREQKKHELQQSPLSGPLQMQQSVLNNQKKKQKHYDEFWCPESAKCHDSALCRPCQNRFLFVMATGRSASTSLTYMLDSLPNVRMSGENNNQLGAIHRMIHNMYAIEYKDEPLFVRNDGKRSAWGHNHVPEQAFACVGQSMIHTMNPPLLSEDEKFLLYERDREDIVGFKTIRFLDGIDDGQEQVVVDFIKQTFPCSRIVINIRSKVEEQAKSAWYLNKSSSAFLQHKNAQLLRLVDIFGPDQAIALDSSQWTKNASELDALIDWLGFHESCRFKELLQFHTKRVYSNAREELSHLDPKCKYLGSSLKREMAT